MLARHEQGAIHAAEGWAKATGEIGVCMATSGPGATNLVTGLADAMMDSVPLLAITGNVARHLMGTDAFQEADITGITLPVTKHNYVVRDVEELPRIIAEAIRIARTGRPGPVLVDIPKDIQMAAYHGRDGLPARPPGASRPQVREAIARAQELLLAAKKPVIMAGRRLAGCQRRNHGARPRLGHSRDYHPDGPGRVSFFRSPVAGHARNARQRGRQPRHQ